MATLLLQVNLPEGGNTVISQCGDRFYRGFQLGVLNWGFTTDGSQLGFSHMEPHSTEKSQPGSKLGVLSLGVGLMVESIL